MIISYYGMEALRIQFGDTVIAYNPVSKESKLKAGKFGADIVIISADHPDFNGYEQASRGDKEPFVINGPGEYEIGGIAIQGFPSKTEHGGSVKINTIYKMTLENMNLCFLGALSSADFVSGDTKQSLGGIDILFTPIGGGGVLDASEAYNLSVKLEPKIIIPIHFGEGVGGNSLKDFLKEGGEEGLKPVDKLTVKKKDLEDKEGDIVVLSPTN